MDGANILLHAVSIRILITSPHCQQLCISAIEDWTDAEEGAFKRRIESLLLFDLKNMRQVYVFMLPVSTCAVCGRSFT